MDSEDFFRRTYANGTGGAQDREAERVRAAEKSIKSFLGRFGTLGISRGHMKRRIKQMKRRKKKKSWGLEGCRPWPEGKGVKEKKSLALKLEGKLVTFFYE